MENKKYEKNPDEIGVLWAKKTKTGNTWFSGILDINGEKISIVIFSNNGKSEKALTHVILKSKPRENGIENPTGQLKQSNFKKVEIPTNEQGLPQIDIDADVNSEDLPF